MAKHVLLEFEGVAKQFVMHLQAGLCLPVVEKVDFKVVAGEMVVLGGASGAGKSSLLKIAYGNYGPSAGRVWVRHEGAAIDLAAAPPRKVLQVRRDTIGYVSQFLSVIPRIGALDLVAQAGMRWMGSAEEARLAAGELLTRLHIPQRLWSLPPATFSGGEQQRVNIARGLIGQHPLLLLDEPTASLDIKNRGVVMDLIAEKRAHGVGMLGIFHDVETRQAVADRVIDVSNFSAAA